MKKKKAEIYPCSKYKTLLIIYSARSKSPHLKDVRLKGGGNISKFSPHFTLIFKDWPRFKICPSAEEPPFLYGIKLVQ